MLLSTRPAFKHSIAGRAPGWKYESGQIGFSIYLSRIFLQNVQSFVLSFPAHFFSPLLPNTSWGKFGSLLQFLTISFWGISKHFASILWIWRFVDFVEQLGKSATMNRIFHAAKGIWSRIILFRNSENFRNFHKFIKCFTDKGIY